MCGIFGFVAKNGGYADRKLLRETAVRASLRGPDGFGIAGRSGSRTHVSYGNGSLASSLFLVEDFLECDAIMGHCRLPTQGGREARHPFRAGDGWLMHNGNVKHPEKFKCQTETSCDTELIAVRVGGLEVQSADAIAKIAEEMHEGIPFAIGFLSSENFALIRKGHPIHVAENKEGFYFSSRSFSSSTMMGESFERLR